MKLSLPPQLKPSDPPAPPVEPEPLPPAALDPITDEAIKSQPLQPQPEPKAEPEPAPAPSPRAKPSPLIPLALAVGGVLLAVVTQGAYGSRNPIATPTANPTPAAPNSGPRIYD